MIYRTPEPRLEPDHHLEEYIAFDGDESDTDFIETHNPDDIDTSFIEEEDNEIRSLLRSQP